MSTLVFITMLIGLGAIIYHQPPKQQAIIAAFTIEFIAFLMGGIGFFGLLIFAGVTGGIAYLVLNDQFRQEKIIAPILEPLKKSLPNISETEKVALEAGTVWWDGEIFKGKINWKKLLKLKSPSFTKEERKFLDGPVEKLCSMIDDWKINNIDKDIPKEVWDYLKKEKFFGLMIPKQYGGLEFSNLLHSEVLAKVAGRSTTVASTVSVPNSLGPAELLMCYGTKEQKEYYLPRLAVGEEIPCFALTGPHAGSDATSIPDIGIVCEQEYKGKNTLGIKVSWDKRYITLAPVATVLGLAFVMRDPNKLLGDKEEIGITCALIPTSHEGVVIGNRHIPLNTMFQNGPTQGRDVFIPLDFIIGGQEMAGQGWRMLVECLSCGRAISLPAAASGKARFGAAVTGGYARIRKQFGQNIGKFEGIKEGLAEIAGYVYQCESNRRITAMMIDNGEKPSVPGAILKYHVTERARKVANHAMDIHAGKAIIMGPKNYIAEGYISTPVGITVEGANILTRNLIIFGQGAIRCHPYIMRELEALQSEDKRTAIAKFDEVLLEHASYSASNAVRAFFSAITFGIFIKSPVKHCSAKFYRQVSWAASAFAFLSDMCLLIVGGKLKFKERLSARLGDMLSMLYLASNTLKRFEDDGHLEQDKALLEWAITDLLATFWQRADEVIQNFPNKYVAFGLRLILMPLGRGIKAPNDKISNKVANILLEPNATRERLLTGTYMSANELNPAGQVEFALKQVIAAEEIESRIENARRKGNIEGYDLEDLAEQAFKANIISDTEKMLVLKAIKARNEIIAVDDFKKEEIKNLKSKPKKSTKSA